MVEKNDKNRSYFSAGRAKRKKNLLIVIPLVIAVSIILTVLSFTPGMPSPGNKMVLHNHAILSVTYDGQPLTVPQHIGMVDVGKAEDPLLFGDHSLDKYGMEGMSPLHTHDANGTIHVEANIARDFKFGEFMDIWKGLSIKDKVVQATVNGNPVSNFRNIILNDGVTIDLNIS